MHELVFFFIFTLLIEFFPLKKKKIAKHICRINIGLIVIPRTFEKMHIREGLGRNHIFHKLA